MSLVHDLYQSILDSEFEKSDSIVRHKLSGQCPAYQRGKLFFAALNVLSSLNGRKLIAPALCLHRDHELTPLPVKANVYLIDLDLPQPLHGGSKMVLE